MLIDECFQLGYVIKNHGLKGEVNIYLDVDYPQDYSDLESVYVDINDKLIPFFIQKIQIRGAKAVVKFEDVDHVEEAEALRAKHLYLPLDFLPELEENQFYYHQIIGYKVVDSKVGNVGEVANVNNSSKQDLLVVVNKDDKEILIPLNDDIIVGIDHNEQMLLCDLPDGLLSVYLD
ncbi:MAG: ribosome maturation factor RimM [Bacteroidota bacterium]